MYKLIHLFLSCSINEKIVSMVTTAVVAGALVIFAPTTTVLHFFAVVDQRSRKHYNSDDHYTYNQPESTTHNTYPCFIDLYYLR